MSEDSEWVASRWLIGRLSPFSQVTAYPERPEDWHAILAAADRGLVLPRLASAVLKCPASVPSDVIQFLDLSRELCRLRDDQLRIQLTTILQVLNKLGIVPVVMKGTVALLDKGTAPTDRLMLDLDICVPEAGNHHLAISALLDLGYTASGSFELAPDSHHFPPFYKRDSLARVELHYRMAGQQKNVIWDEHGACVRLETQELNGLHFRILHPGDALRLSYLQCRWVGRMGFVILMKWLDFLDRCHDQNMSVVRGLRSFGIESEGDRLDRQLLTALSELAGLPYSGPRDSSMLTAWQQAYRDPVFIRVFKNVFRNALQPGRWADKPPGEILRIFVGRLSGIRENLNRARNRDAF